MSPCRREKRAKCARARRVHRARPDKMPDLASKARLYTRTAAKKRVFLAILALKSAEFARKPAIQSPKEASITPFLWGIALSGGASRRVIAQQFPNRLIFVMERAATAPFSSINAHTFSAAPRASAARHRMNARQQPHFCRGAAWRCALCMGRARHGPCPPDSRPFHAMKFLSAETYRKS